MESGSDPVLWHCFGLTHFVRPEDFPVMPAESAGFTLKPVGFFRGNPGIDIPYQANKASKLCCSGSTANGHAHTNGHAASNGHANSNGHVRTDRQTDNDKHANGEMHGIQAGQKDSAAGSMNGILNDVAQKVANGMH